MAGAQDQTLSEVHPNSATCSITASHSQSSSCFNCTCTTFCQGELSNALPSICMPPARQGPFATGLTLGFMLSLPAIHVTSSIIASVLTTSMYTARSGAPDLRQAMTASTTGTRFCRQKISLWSRPWTRRKHGSRTSGPEIGPEGARKLLFLCSRLGREQRGW